jgi:hypothetical protein
MDGRVQYPVNDYLRARYGVDHVDVVSEAGPILYLSDKRGTSEEESILRRVDVSVQCHKSVGIAVVGHWDCTGNPVSEEQQKRQIEESIVYLRGIYTAIQIVGLWVDSNWQVERVVVR